MSELPYQNREIDEMMHDIRSSLQRVELNLEVVSKKLDFTNGKVRKIIIALVAIAAFSFGSGVTNGAMLGAFFHLLGL